MSDSVGLSDEAIAEITQLNEYRTPGQWTHIEGAFQAYTYVKTQDLRFIAACTWAVPALLEEVRRLRKALALSESARASSQQYIKELQKVIDRHAPSDDSAVSADNMGKALDLALMLTKENLQLKEASNERKD